jgi:hypothetical protein
LVHRKVTALQFEFKWSLKKAKLLFLYTHRKILLKHPIIINGTLRKMAIQ